MSKQSELPLQKPRKRKYATPLDKARAHLDKAERELLETYGDTATQNAMQEILAAPVTLSRRYCRAGMETPLDGEHRERLRLLRKWVRCLRSTINEEQKTWRAKQ